MSRPPKRRSRRRRRRVSTNQCRIPSALKFFAARAYPLRREPQSGDEDHDLIGWLVCSTGSYQPLGRAVRPVGFLPSTRNDSRKITEILAMTAAFIEFARSADNRYGSSRSSSSRGKLWVTRLSAGMGACGSATRTPLVGYTHRPRRKLTESKLRARWLESTRRNLTCGISPSDQPWRFRQSFYSG